MEVPENVTQQEAGILYRFMKYGKPRGRIEFADSRNQVIFDCLKHLKTQVGYFANSEAQLISFMEEYGYIQDIGGKAYVHSIFQGYEDPVLGLRG